MQEKASDDSRQPILEALRFVGILMVWALWLPMLGLAIGGSWLWGYLRSKPWGWITSLAIVGCMAFLGIKLIPLVYGRFALVYEAAYLARTSAYRNHEEIQGLLTREAFLRGYSSVLAQRSAFTIENTSDRDGLLICVISINLSQRVDLVGPLYIPMSIRTKVKRSVDPQTERPKTFSDWVHEI